MDRYINRSIDKTVTLKVLEPPAVCSF